MLSFFSFSFFLSRQGFYVQPWLSWNSLCVVVCSPKKNMTIGSHNGCYNTGSLTASSGGDSKDEEASESEE